jgi:hypothetical protein
LELAHPVIDEILRLLGQGFGRTMACLMAEVPYRRFLEKYREDPEFAEQVRTHEASRVEMCEKLLLDVIMNPYDTPLKIRASIAYLGRHDRRVAAQHALREKREKARPAAPKTP